MTLRALAIPVVILAAFAAVAEMTGIGAIAVAGVGVGSFVVIEQRMKCDSSKHRDRALAWPAFVEYLVSAFESGVSPFEAFVDAPDYFDSEIGDLARSIRSSVLAGESTTSALRAQRGWLGFAPYVLLCAQLDAYEQTGAPGIAELLRHSADDARAAASLDAELSARRGWILGTARLGVLSPWLMVILLSQRAEARTVYQGATGYSLLIGGALVCALAYGLILRRSVQQPWASNFWSIT